SALRSAVEHVSGRAIGREDSLDGIIKAGVGAGAYGKCAEGGKILRLAILGVEIVLGVGGLRRGLLLIGGQSDDAGGGTDLVVGARRRILGEGQGDGPAGIDGDLVHVGQV